MRTVGTIGWLLMLLGSQVAAQTGKPTNGLTGEYFNGPNFERKVLTRIDPAVDFDWNGQYPGPGVQREYFSVRWTGKLYAPRSGRYRFSALADDGVRVWVNGKKVIDEWRKQDDSNFAGDIALVGGRSYDLRIEYFNDWKGSVISVFWEMLINNRPSYKSPLPRQVIAGKYLTPKSGSRTSLVRTPSATVKAKLAGTSVVKKELVSKPATPQKSISVASISSNRTAASSRLPASPFANLKAGNAFVLRHVLFAQGDYKLLSESYAELDELVQALRANPALRIEVAGHTDNVGDKRLNLALSENRAKVVASYLIRHGVAENRITAKGYGGTKPIANNADEAQRPLNRRVELVVR
ncbi:OmpA family protein [Spirosoma spitsbergense]|uniref:OmpA family protein n=1 Tax=Spirosoma spitsbergense TaxID=431554 RepID=UPI0004779DFD|nr:PA14 domain-containing protein [Spirosoma spitsbergense]